MSSGTRGFLRAAAIPWTVIAGIAIDAEKPGLMFAATIIAIGLVLQSVYGE